MSKIIYRKIRTAPGVKQYLDDEKTQVNPQFEANSAYFAQAVTLETLSLRDMAKHITSHGSPFTADVVIGVLEAFRSCLIEQLLESKKVKVQGLGTFYVTIANKEGGIKRPSPTRRAASRTSPTSTSTPSPRVSASASSPRARPRRASPARTSSRRRSSWMWQPSPRTRPSATRKPTTTM